MVASNKVRQKKKKKNRCLARSKFTKHVSSPGTHWGRATHAHMTVPSLEDRFTGGGPCARWGVVKEGLPGEEAAQCSSGMVVRGSLDRLG